MDSDEATKKIRKLAEDPENIMFASQDGVDSFSEAFVDEFLSEICGVKGGAWISDASDLWDFGCLNEECYVNIEEKYGVDCRHTQGNLLAIFRAINAQNRTPQ